VLVCERGTMFGYSDLVVDPRNFVLMRDAGCPVTADVTHALQQPAGRALEGGGVASGGLRDLIPAVARAAVAVGVDGIFMEVHDDPSSSPVDGPTQWPLRNLRLLAGKMCLAASISGRCLCQSWLPPIWGLLGFPCLVGSSTRSGSIVSWIVEACGAQRKFVGERVASFEADLCPSCGSQVAAGGTDCDCKRHQGQGGLRD
jgi:DAHP synthetase I family